jgi:hypothetical protein
VRDLPEEVVRQWVPPEVYTRMTAGGGEFLTELRPCVPLFLSFRGIDYDADPDSAAALDDVVTRAQRIVAGYGGNVLQLTIGDKGSYLYAVFGSPVAHEDDAARACAGALELVRLGEVTAARELKIGIASGDLRSGTYGHPERRTFTCMGDATNLAARLMSAAPTGGIYATAAIRAAAGAEFDWDVPVRLPVKGKAEPVAASALVGQRGYGDRSPDSPTGALIGRTAELARLRELANIAMAGVGQVVVVAGPAGVGKSHLIAELSRWLVGQGVAVRSGAPRSYGARTPYAVWRDICRAAWRIEPDAAPAQVVARLESVLTTLEPTLLPRLPLLGPVVGVTIPDTDLTASFDAKLRKSSLEALMVDLLAAHASRRPIAVFLDAAEHLDELSVDLLEVLARALARLPALFVVAERTEAGAESTTLAELRNRSTVDLSALDEAASRDLVQRQWRERGSGPLPEGLLERLIALAEGNPLHLDELVNHLATRPVHEIEAGELALPTSLHSLQLARIDDLAEQPRRTLKVASVAGMRFDLPALRGAYPELGDRGEVRSNVGVLTATALVAPQPEGVDDFSFRHATTQQVAYETLTFQARTLLHDRFLGWLEARSRAESTAVLDLLAYHARNGSDLGKRREYLRRAGVAAQDNYANEAAVDYFTELLDLVEGAEQGAVLRRLGQVLGLVGRWAEAEETFRSAVQRCAEAGDRAAAAHARTDLADVVRKQGRFEEATALLAEADTVFSPLGDRDGRAAVLHLSGTLAGGCTTSSSIRTAAGAAVGSGRAPSTPLPRCSRPRRWPSSPRRTRTTPTRSSPRPRAGRVGSRPRPRTGRGSAEDPAHRSGAADR